MEADSLPTEARTTEAEPNREEVCRRAYDNVSEAVEAMYSMIEVNAFTNDVLFTLETYSDETAAVILIHLVY